MADAVARPRRWLAIGLSLAMLGLGHAYVGVPLRGLAFTLASTLVLALAVWLHVGDPSIATLAAMGVAASSVLGITIFAAVDAARIARAPRARFTSRGAILFVCLAYIGAAAAVQQTFEWWSHRLAESYYVPSGAMQPTLLIGEASTNPEGEAVRARSESLGAHPYFVWDEVTRDPVETDTVVVEPDRYFLAGDNRDNSNDSRYWGTVHRDDILGRATELYWSWDNKEPWVRMLNPFVVWRLIRDKTRWDRIGRAVK